VQSQTSVANQINSTESLRLRLSATNLARDRRSGGLARRRARNGRTSVLHNEAMDLQARQSSRDVGRLSPNVGRFAVSLSEAFEPRYSDLETIIETAWRSRAQAGRGHHTGIPTPFTPS
jgi:hypothetical protein